METKFRCFIVGMTLIGLLISLAPASITWAARNCFALQVLRIIQGQASPSKVDQAIAWGNQLLQKAPADQATRRLLGHLYIQNQQVHLASNALQSTMIDCTDPIMCLEQGWALYQLGGHESALHKWRSITNIDIYFAYQGDLAYLQQDKKRALELYALSWAISPSPSSKKETMFLNLCREHRSNREMEAGIAWCLQAVASNRNYWALVELGRTYYEARRYELAEAVLREAISQAPGQASAYQWLGLNLYKQGQKQEAVEALITSVQLAPTNVWMHLDLGNIYQLEGDYQSAACEYIRALALTGEKTLITEIQNRLISLPITQPDLSTSCGLE